MNNAAKRVLCHNTLCIIRVDKIKKEGKLVTTLYIPLEVGDTEAYTKNCDLVLQHLRKIRPFFVEIFEPHYLHLSTHKVKTFFVL